MNRFTCGFTFWEDEDPLMYTLFIYLKEKNDLAKTKALVPNSIRIIMDRDNYIYLLILLQQRRYKLAEPA
jgi:hypothetical protein